MTTIIKKTVNAGKYVGKKEHSYTVVGDVN
jgi:hypothetical protein